MPFCKITRNPNNVPYGYVRKGSPQKKGPYCEHFALTSTGLCPCSDYVQENGSMKKCLNPNIIQFPFQLSAGYQLRPHHRPLTISPNLLPCSNPLSRVLVLTSSLSGPQWALTCYVCAILWRPHPNMTYSVSRAPVPSARIALVPLPLYIFTLFGDLIFMYRQQQCSTLHS